MVAIFAIVISRSALLNFNDGGKLISLTDCVDWSFAKSKEKSNFITVTWMLYWKRDRRRDITKLSLLYKIIFICLSNFFVYLIYKSLIIKKCCDFKIIWFIHWSR